MTRSVLKTSTSFVALSFALAVSGNASAASLPTHGHYIDGHGSINKANQSLTVKQSSTTGIINWNSFSIGQGNHVRFDNGDGATLNQVTGGNLSRIAGSLHATGSLYLINSQGVIVSGTGRVVTGGSFVATSGNISDTAFDDGKRRFFGAKAAVVNRGSITAGGSARLIGSTVDQAGSIKASNVTLRGNDRLTISGSVTAQRADGAGGRIIATARKVDVTGAARISASGTAGGTVLIGGDVHGGAIASEDFYGRKIRDARTTTVAAGAQISANAVQGTGGDIVIWSDGHTTFSGQVSAAGGAAGGFAEVSSHKVLAFAGNVDLLATGGQTGTLLLDPENVVIEDGTTTGSPFSGGTYTPSADDSILSVSDLEAALANADVTVTSGSAGSQAGDITVLSPIAWSANKLTLDANHSIDIDALVTANTDAALALITNDGGTGGDFFFNNGGRIVFTGYTNDDDTHLAINGQAYTLENSTSALVTAINGNSSGFYALADNYDASGDNGGFSYSASLFPAFTGTFEGLGNTISNLSIDDTTAGDFVGLFAQLGTNATAGVIRDIGLANASITSTGQSANVGGLVGNLINGTMSGSHVTGTVSGATDAEVGGLVGSSREVIANSYASVTVLGGSGSLVGGLVGLMEDGSVSSSYATGNVSATGPDVGGLVGFVAGGSISNSHATGDVSGGADADVGGLIGEAGTATIENDYATGTISGAQGAKVGGFAGGIDALDIISQDYSTGDVSVGANGYAGGFAGKDFSDISQSYASGSVTGADSTDLGGFIGSDGGIAITHAYATGAVTGAGSATAGGFVGVNNVSGTIDESYATGAATVGQSGSAGGFAGENDNSAGIGASVADYYNSTANMGQGVGSDAGSSDVHGLALTAMRTASSFSGWTFGTTGGDSGWVIVDLDGSLNNNGGYPTGGTTPMLLSEYSTTITNAHQLQLMALDLSANYTLAGNIDASTTAGGDVWSSNGFVPIGNNIGNDNDAYTGTFDGQNHVIDGLFIDSGSSGTHPELSWVGLFGYLGGTAENVGLSNVNITGNNSGSGGYWVGVGALAGDSFGTITNAWSSGTVTASQKDGSDTFVGGLVGSITGGTIANSHSSATVSNLGTLGAAGGLLGYAFSTFSDTIENSYATGNVSGGDVESVGGFIGLVYGDLSVTDSYATGAVSGGNGSDTGGFVGEDDNDDSTITRSFATGNVTGGGDDSDYYAKGYYGGFAGKADAQISEAYAVGNVSKASGAPSGGNFGGFIGGVTQDALISDAYATGSVAGDSTATTVGGFVGSNDGYIDESYTLSKVTGGETTGAFAGSNTTTGSLGASVEDFYDSDVNGSLARVGATSGSGTVNVGGLNNVQIRTASNFTGWTFDTTPDGSGWAIVDQNGSLNNDSGATGGTTPMLLSEYATTITNAHQLQLMELDPTAYYTLVNDIDASATESGTDVWGIQGFIAVGGNNASGEFTGTFDGQNHVIDSLSMEDGTNSNVGLFGLVGAGTVENVSLTNVDIAGTVSGAHIGGVIGFLDGGTLDDIYVSGTVSGGNNINGANGYVGGAVGYNNGAVDGVVVSGIVSGGATTNVGLVTGQNNLNLTNAFGFGTVTGGVLSQAGGLVGTNANTGVISHSGAVAVVSGTDAGGFVGGSSGAITTSYAIATVSGSDTAGGFVGANYPSGTIDESYAKSTATGTASAGAFAGFSSGTLGGTIADYYDSSLQADSSTFVNGGGLTTSQMMNLANFSGWSFGALGSGADWVIVDEDASLNNASGTGGTTPMLLSEYSTTITNGHQLQLMELDPTQTYTLANNINAGGTAGGDVWGSQGFIAVGGANAPSNGFTGVFDGENHTIGNLFINDSTNMFVGLFGSNAGSISDLTLSNASVSIMGAQGVLSLELGVLAGGNSGSIDNVTVSGTVSASNMTEEPYGVGGLVGANVDGNITSSDSSASVSLSGSTTTDLHAGGLTGLNTDGAISESYSTGSVTVEGKQADAGGLVGMNGGSISQSWSSGAVTAISTGSGTGSISSAGGLVGTNMLGTISQSYAIGTATVGGGAASMAGGLVGDNESTSTITRSYAIGTVTGGTGATLGGLIGLDNTSSGSITNSYFDTQTSGIGASQGAGNIGSDSGIAGKTTSALEAGLPSGFGGSAWGIVAGTSLPYLNWQFPSGAPQVVSGVELSGVGGAGLSGATVSVMQNGADLNSALTGGSVVTYANGFYYFLLAPGSIDTSSNPGLIVYDTANDAEVFADQADGSLTGLDLTASYLRETTAQSALSAVNADLLSAAGGTNPIAAPNLEIDSAGTAFNIDSAINIGSGTLILTQASGQFDQSSAITAGGLLLDGGSNFTLDDASNVITTLAADSGSLDVTSRDLTIGTVAGVSGVVANGGVGLRTTTGNIVITQRLEAEAHPLMLTSAGKISESGSGKIEATALSGSSHGAVTLNGGNVVADLGAFTTHGNHAFSLTDAHDLTVDGLVDAGTAAMTLATTGGGHDMRIDGKLVASTVTLHSAATITQTGSGAIDASNLTGSSHGVATLTSATNDVLDLESFSTGGNNKFALKDNAVLTTSGTVNAGTADIDLTTIGSGHAIAVHGTLEAGVADLVAAGSISENGSGKIEATTLKGSSVGSAILDNAGNKIADLGAFTSSGMFELADERDLKTTGTVNAGTHEIKLITKGSGHDITIDSKLEGGEVKLVSAATITEGGSGLIDATTLTGSSAGSAQMGSAGNVITDLGAFTSGGALNLVDDHSLTTDGAINAGTHDITLTTKGSGHAINIDSKLTGGQVKLVSAAAVAQNSSGAIVATTLTGSSAGAATLKSKKNVIANLGAFTSGGNFALVDDDNLTTTGKIDAGSHNVNLTTVGSDLGIAIKSAVEAKTVNLVLTGEATESNKGAIVADLLNVHAGTGIELTSNANMITKVGKHKTNTGPNTITK